MSTKYAKTIFIIAFIGTLIGTVPLWGQHYGTAFGFRGGGGEIGMTLQQRIAERATFEVIATFTTQHVTVNGLFELHKPLISKGFNFYVGGGPHIGRLLDDEITYYGLTGIVGLEWKILALPLVISADLRPEFHLEHPTNTEIKYGVSVRYVIVSKNAKKKKARQKEKSKVRKKEPNKVIPKTKYRFENWWERNMNNKKKKKKRKKKRQKRS